MRILVLCIWLFANGNVYVNVNVKLTQKHIHFPKVGKHFECIELLFSDIYSESIAGLKAYASLAKAKDKKNLRIW